MKATTLVALALFTRFYFSAAFVTFSSPKMPWTKPTLRAVEFVARAKPTIPVNENPATVPEKMPKRVLKSVFRSVRELQIFPTVFSFVAGYKLGMKAALRQMSKATDVVTPQSTIAVRTVLLQAALIALIAREFWRLIPSWVKRQIPFVRAKKETAEIDPNDLSSISSLSIKLQALFSKISDKLDDDGPEPAASQTSLLALLMLIAQVKEQIPDFRDSSFDAGGLAVQNPEEELAGLDEIFEFADWAYDEFDEDETLAKALANYSFTLLVSRTFS